MYPINTNDDNDVFVVMRRVHWHADDIIAHILWRSEISSAERRLLDALYYAKRRGLERLSTSALCDMTPTLRPQTAASILRRLTDKNGLSFVRDEGNHDRQQHWSLTDDGEQRRSDCCVEIERQLQVFYDSRVGSSRNPFLERVPDALEYIDAFLTPVIDRFCSGSLAPAPKPLTMWSGLRRVHFYISDAVYLHTQNFGIGPVERRVLDAIGYGRKNGLTDGLNLGTICRLCDAVTRPVAQTAVKRLVDWNWLSQTVDHSKNKRSAGRVLWRLTEQGDAAREAYKRRTQLLLREILDPNKVHGGDLFDLAVQAGEQRNRRLSPGLRYLKPVA